MPKIVIVMESFGPKNGTTHSHAQLGLPDKDCAIKELVVCLTFVQKFMQSKIESDKHEYNT